MNSDLKRVVVFVDGGVADAVMDAGIEWELVDWDSIESGQGWNRRQMTHFKEWSRGLVSDEVLKRLDAAFADDVDRSHQILLGNGRVLIVEEREDGRLSVALQAQDPAHGVDAYICDLTDSGVLVMPNSGDALSVLLEDL